ncbi:MAG: hypothetical protein ACRED0_01395 [Gammaproteobacteria bacterium]
MVFCAERPEEGIVWHDQEFLGPVLHELAGQRRSVILEGHMVQDRKSYRPEAKGRAQ